MDQNTIEIIGFIAATLTTISFLPQAIKTIKTNDTKGLSFTMYTLFTLGVLLWGIYGYLTLSYPIIIANAITFVLASIILSYKVKNRYFRK